MKNRIAALCALLLIALCSWNSARGQVAESVMSGKSILNAGDVGLPEVPVRVTSRVDESKLVKLSGNTHPLARAEFDRGPVSPGLPMERMILVLERSREQETALEQFMNRQLDPSSPDFHRWLQPQEFGAQYGPADSDIQAVCAWLESHGFTVDEVAAGRVFLEISGTAGMVEQAFHTSIHRYQVNGEEHIANSTDPSIPEALRPVVAGVASLNDFRLKSMHIDMGSFRRDPSTGKWSPLNDDRLANPLFAVSNGGTNYELVTPYDFATIYNVVPAWNVHIDGAGQTIAIAGRSNISLADVANFRLAFGLPAKAPTVFVNGTDPGMSDADSRQENTLDVEWAGAVAKGANIKLVASANSATTDGEVASAMYIVDHNTAPIMSFSYGDCELNLGTTLDATFNKMWQQGAAEGISVFVSTGDSGAAGCSPAFRAETAAASGLGVSGSASTPYDVAVGGTDFIWANLTTKYWNTTNAANGSSVLGYIPEVPWNGSCASDDVDKLLGLFAKGYGEEGSCDYMQANNFHTNRIDTTGGGGGVSSCTTPSSTYPSSCSGGYSKPAWQAGTGVPADGKRDIPDVSLFASNGTLNSSYLICDSASTPCTFTDPADTVAQGVGGTSVASPAMAGIMALILQKVGGAPQGLPNPVFYKLAAKQPVGGCTSLGVQAGNSCIFYDIAEDNNAVPCGIGTLNCNAKSTNPDDFGILSGYKAGTGYDLATGLGSVNANNLVNGWSSAAPAASVSIKPTSLTFAGTLVGKSAPPQTVTLTNTGGAWLNFPTNSVGMFGGSYASFPGVTTCNAPLAPGGKCTVTVTFTPKSAGALATTMEFGDNAPASPQMVKLTGTGTTPIVVTLSQTSLDFIYTTVGTTSGGYLAVSATNTSSKAVNLGPVSITGTNASSFLEFNACGTSLAAGASCWVYVAFEPVTSGYVFALLSFSDSADAAAQLVGLDGTGEPAPTVTLSPASLTFPATAKGTFSPPQIVTLTNKGLWLLMVQTVQIEGPGASSFVAINNCGGQYVGYGQTCTILVAMQPAATGSLNAQMVIIDNAGDSPQFVPLTGTGK